jgi:Leucine-rich repeat (LRR) protein
MLFVYNNDGLGYQMNIIKNNKILNPVSGRYVLMNRKLGSKLLNEYLKSSEVLPSMSDDALILYQECMETDDENTIKVDNEVLPSISVDALLIYNANIYTNEENTVKVDDMESFKNELLNLQHKNVKYLRILGNVMYIPPEIEYLTSLEYLDLSYNRLETLPIEVCNLRNLQTLRLTGNKLCSLPNEICKLKMIEMLHIDNNKITELPESIGEMTLLQGLYANNNQLVTIPCEMCKLQCLIWIELINNNIIHIPFEINCHIVYKYDFMGMDWIDEIPDMSLPTILF